MSNKTIEVIIIENHTNVVHRTVSTVYEDSNTYNVAIQTIIESLTGTKPISKVQAVAIPLSKDKFAQAVPDYKAPVEEKTEFHPDLIKAGVAPKVSLPKESEIPVVKIDMKSVLKGAK